MITIHSNETDTKNIYKLMIGTIVPRPIAFVSTVSNDGINNLAPFSFFMGVSASPPTLAISIAKKGFVGNYKDTNKNILDTNEFVVNIVTENIANAMNLTAGEFAPEIDEFKISKLTPIQSKFVKPKRVKESPINMECKLMQVIEIGNPTTTNLIIGEIICFHIEENIFENFRIDIEKLKPIARLAGNSYCKVNDIFELTR